MPLNYLENRVWYVETASNDGAQPTKGSAVAIRLQKKGDPLTSTTYLLTCEHVVQAPSVDNRNGGGAVLPLTRVWAPDTGYNDSQAKVAQIVTDIRPPHFEEGDHNSKTVATDWVVLRICDSQASAAASAICQAGEFAAGKEFCVCGYPGGSSSFPNGIVKPEILTEDLRPQHEFQGELRLIGAEGRPGLSGGGVFEVQTKHFVGLHRGRIDAAFQLQAVHSKTIFEQIARCGYELSSGDDPNDGGRDAGGDGDPGCGSDRLNTVVQILKLAIEQRNRSTLLKMLKSIELSDLIPPDSDLRDELVSLYDDQDERRALVHTAVKWLHDSGSAERALPPGYVTADTRPRTWAIQLLTESGKFGAPGLSAICAVVIWDHPSARVAMRTFAALCEEYGDPSFL